MRGSIRKICFVSPHAIRVSPRGCHRIAFIPNLLRHIHVNLLCSRRFSSVAKSEAEEIDDSDGYVVQPDNADSPKMFRVIHPPLQCPEAKFVISWLNPHNSHQFLEESVIGWYVDHPTLDDDGAVVLEPSKFVENPIFKDFMHARIQECLENKQENNLDFSQVGTVGGWTNIVDVAPWRVGAGVDTIHTIGSIRVDELGNIEPGTYAPNPVHRLLTPNGLFRLPDAVQKCILCDLEVDLLQQSNISSYTVAEENMAGRRRANIPTDQKHKLEEREKHLKAEDVVADSPNQAAGKSGHVAPGASTRSDSGHMASAAPNPPE